MIDNKYHLVAFEGTTIAPKRHLLGNNGLVQINPPVDLVDSFERYGRELESLLSELSISLSRWVDQGFPHHVCVVNGWHKKNLTQFAKNHNIVVLS